MSSSVDAAESIRSVISDAQDGGSIFGLRFGIERAYVPLFALEEREPAGLSVVICPMAHSNINQTRATNQQQPVIVIAVIQKLIDLTNETIDPLIELVEQIKGLVSGSLDVGGYRALCNLDQKELLFDPDKLVGQRIFWSRITVNVQVIQ